MNFRYSQITKTVAFLMHILSHVKRIRIKLLYPVLLLGCCKALGTVDTEPQISPLIACSFVQSTPASKQTIVIGKLLGHPETSNRAILIERGVIQKVGPVDDIKSDAPHSLILKCENVLISPGFVNAHEHPPYSAGRPGPYVKPVYTNRYQWQGGAGDQYKEIAYSRVENDAQLYWVELRHLLAGTTTLAGNGAVQGLLKNVGTGSQDVGFVYQADMKTFPFPQAIDEFEQLPWPYHGPSFEPELTEGANRESAFVPHIAEGTDKISNLEAEFFLDYVEKNPGRRYAMIHGVGLHKSRVPRMQLLDVTLVWSPRSNLALYGTTVDVPHLITNGVRVALSTDWSYSGSYNMLESFRCAKHVTDERWNNRLSAQDLWRMATENGAYALNLEQTTGTLKHGFAADLVIIKSRTEHPYSDLVTSSVSDVIATFVDGELVTGQRSAFKLSELPQSCSNIVGDHFVCDDLSKRDFTWQELLEENDSFVPLFEPDGQSHCAF